MIQVGLTDADLMDTDLTLIVTRVDLRVRVRVHKVLVSLTSYILQVAVRKLFYAGPG